MSDYEAAEQAIFNVLCGQFPGASINAWTWAAQEIAHALADRGLLVTPSTPDGPRTDGETLGWEVLTRQPDGTWLADWDAETHPTRDAAEHEATRAASREQELTRGVAWPARVARLVADGPIHEPDATGEVHSGQ